MKHFLAILILIAGPALGAVAGGAVDRQAVTGDSFDAVMARGPYVLWGGVGGGAVSVVSLIALARTGTSRRPTAGPSKNRLQCNACGARRPLTPIPEECSWCQARWSGSEVVT